MPNRFELREKDVEEISDPTDTCMINDAKLRYLQYVSGMCGLLHIAIK